MDADDHSPPCCERWTPTLTQRSRASAVERRWSKWPADRAHKGELDVPEADGELDGPGNRVNGGYDVPTRIADPDRRHGA